MTTPRLVIFDCDGVLIDSEVVVCRLVSEAFTAVGYPVSVADVTRRFAGRPEGEMIADVEADWGRPVPAAYFERVKPLVLAAYATELKPVPGVADTLDRLRLPRCVASSSHPDKLRLGLEVTGLLPKLAPNLVSAAFVARGKPAPDVFVYAAGWMRTPVGRCVVVEDSEPGTRAAVAAGMRVVGFAGGGHCPPGHADRLLAAGAEQVIHDFRELGAAIPEAF